MAVPAHSSMELARHIVTVVQSVLTDDLLKPPYTSHDGLDGHCYHASEAVYHLLGGASSGYVPHRISWGDGRTHWYLVDAQGRMLDPTLVDWETRTEPDSGGRPKQFYTFPKPSSRAREVLKRVRLKGLAL